MFLISAFKRSLDEEIRLVVRGQTNIGHEGRHVCTYLEFIEYVHVGTGCPRINITMNRQTNIG